MKKSFLQNCSYQKSIIKTKKKTFGMMILILITANNNIRQPRKLQRRETDDIKKRSIASFA